MNAVTLKVEFVDGKVLVKKGGELWKEAIPPRPVVVAQNVPMR